MKRKNINISLNIVLRIMILVSMSRFVRSRNSFRYKDFNFEALFTNFKIGDKMALIKNY